MALTLPQGIALLLSRSGCTRADLEKLDVALPNRPLIQLQFDRPSPHRAKLLQIEQPAPSPSICRGVRKLSTRAWPERWASRNVHGEIEAKVTLRFDNRLTRCRLHHPFGPLNLFMGGHVRRLAPIRFTAPVKG